jgi:hypothetical protein
MSPGGSAAPVDYSESRDGQLLTVGIVFIVLAFLSVVARIYSKTTKRIPLQSDDWLLVAALVLAVGETVMFLEGTSTSARNGCADWPPPNPPTDRLFHL